MHAELQWKARIDAEERNKNHGCIYVALVRFVMPELCESIIPSKSNFIKCGANGCAHKFTCNTEVSVVVKTVFYMAQVATTATEPGDWGPVRTGRVSRYREAYRNDVRREFDSINAFNSEYILQAYFWFIVDVETGTLTFYRCHGRTTPITMQCLASKSRACLMCNLQNMFSTNTEGQANRPCPPSNKEDWWQLQKNTRASQADVTCRSLSLLGIDGTDYLPYFGGIILECMSGSFDELPADLDTVSVYSLLVDYFRGLVVLFKALAVHGDIKGDNLMFIDGCHGGRKGKLIDLGEIYFATSDKPFGVNNLNAHREMSEELSRLSNIPPATRTELQRRAMKNVIMRFDTDQLLRTFRNHFPHTSFPFGDRITIYQALPEAEHLLQLATHSLAN